MLDQINIQPRAAKLLINLATACILYVTPALSQEMDNCPFTDKTVCQTKFRSGDGQKHQPSSSDEFKETSSIFIEKAKSDLFRLMNQSISAYSYINPYSPPHVVAQMAAMFNPPSYDYGYSIISEEVYHKYFDRQKFILPSFVASTRREGGIRDISYTLSKKIPGGKVLHAFLATTTSGKMNLLALLCDTDNNVVGVGLPKPAVGSSPPIIPYGNSNGQPVYPGQNGNPFRAY